MNTLWVVEERIGDAWLLVNAYLTREIARDEASFHRAAYGNKTRVVKYIREAA